MQQKLEEKKAEVELERTQACTFAPKLVSQQIVKEGRVMKVSLKQCWHICELVVLVVTGRSLDMPIWFVTQALYASQHTQASCLSLLVTN